MSEKYTIRKLVEFECSHQLTKAVSHLCNATIHGHSYKAELYFEAEQLTDDMVIDFGALKGIKEMIMEKYDHALFLSESLERVYDYTVFEGMASKNERLRIVPGDTDPSAEWMARDIYTMLVDWLDLNKEVLPRCVCVAKVRVHETRTGWAEYSQPTFTQQELLNRIHVLEDLVGALVNNDEEN